MEQAFEFTNDTICELGAHFFSTGRHRCFLAAWRPEAGSIWINDIHSSMLQVPHGGMKQSGIGRERGLIVVDEYFEWKTVYHKMSKEPRRPRMCVHR